MTELLIPQNDFLGLPIYSILPDNFPDCWSFNNLEKEFSKFGLVVVVDWDNWAEPAHNKLIKLIFKSEEDKLLWELKYR